VALSQLPAAALSAAAAAAAGSRSTAVCGDYSLSNQAHLAQFLLVVAVAAVVHAACHRAFQQDRCCVGSAGWRAAAAVAAERSVCWCSCCSCKSPVQ
jgi:hypothetical protein